MTLFDGSTVLESIAAHEYGPDVSAVLALRQKQVGLMERAYRSLFEHTGADGLSVEERAFFAAHTATAVRELSLAAHYRTLLDRQIETGISAPLDAAISERLTLLFQLMRLMTTSPSAVTRKNIADLERAGLTAAEIVTFAQLVAFVCYQARVLHGLRLFSSQNDPAIATLEQDVCTPAIHRNFTLEVLRWQPWLQPVTLASATPVQRSALAECGVPPRDSAYFRVLAHAPAALRERTRLYNAILFDSGGLPRAEREFATVAVSRSNGCVYCASVHARRFADLTKATAPIDAFLRQGNVTGLSPRLQAIERFARRLSEAPGKLGRNDLEQLENAGFTKLEILDLIQATALFAWANRLMLTLGEPESALGETANAQ
ncbi:peroxidase-related enzyme [Telmatobacter bradus]|uniref:peroxidase-related enzyme n=1 Tax=Telmatobacter bradus TaxID=474953 RepID=UPI003B42AE6F